MHTLPHCSRRLFEILTKICEGKGTPEMLTQLHELGEVIKDTALCGLATNLTEPRSPL